MVVGGGAAGFFGAIHYAEINPGSRIIILEAAKEVLSKVRVSGGGRCNVTNACFDPRQVITNYPRGSKELLGPFTNFGPQETIYWFNQHGIQLKTEKDGRIFPVSDNSETIIQCFLDLCKKYGIKICVSERVMKFYQQEDLKGWEIETSKAFYNSKNLFIATGSDRRIWDQLEEMGYHIISPVPSLFTFNVSDKLLNGLMGISVDAVNIKIKETKHNSTGSILITHWGFSGPAILRLSARAARELYDLGYEFEISIQWVSVNKDELINQLNEAKRNHSKKTIVTDSLFGIPARLWNYLMDKSGINDQLVWAQSTSRQWTNIIKTLTDDSYKVSGKSTYKEEFVTAGGVDLKQINFRNFESKIHKGLFMAGELLNIDAITGGFNFQAAWTGGYLVADGME